MRTEMISCTSSDRRVQGAALDELARELCDRHTGVGADGLIVYAQTKQLAAMRLFNADGSTAEVSGKRRAGACGASSAA